MPVSIIDTSLHTAAIPPQYTGPGTIPGNAVNSQGKDVFGFCTSVAGNTIQINCGFQPLMVTVTDTTGNFEWYWQLGFPANNAIKWTLGTVAAVMDATGQIVVATDLAGNGTVTLGTTLCGSGKNLCYQISG